MMNIVLNSLGWIVFLILIILLVIFLGRIKKITSTIPYWMMIGILVLPCLAEEDEDLDIAPIPDPGPLVLPVQEAAQIVDAFLEGRDIQAEEWAVYENHFNFMGNDSANITAIGNSSGLFTA